MDITAFNTECSICFSDKNPMIILSCLHKFHEECLEGHTNLDCPTCRQNVVNWPPRLKEKIKKNSLNLRDDLESQDRRRLIEAQERNAEVLSRLSMFLQPPPEAEIISAMQYLRENGIPLRYIPQGINIRVSKNQPKPIPGVLFSTLVDKVLKSIQEDISSEELEIEENSDDNENPFYDENEILETLSRNVKYIDSD